MRLLITGCFVTYSILMVIAASVLFRRMPFWLFVCNIFTAITLFILVWARYLGSPLPNDTLFVSLLLATFIALGILNGRIIFRKIHLAHMIVRVILSIFLAGLYHYFL